MELQGQHFDLFTIDVLARSGVTIDFDVTNERVRFQAHRLLRWRRQRHSQFSGWFPLADCPVHLAWEAFDWG